jgi:hypothetical protein
LVRAFRRSTLDALYADCAPTDDLRVVVQVIHADTLKQASREFLGAALTSLMADYGVVDNGVPAGRSRTSPRAT